MADETIIEPSAEPSPAQQRITQLSEKVRLTSEERDEKNRLLEESKEKIAGLERENAFNSGFVDILGTHSAAKDHKDDIKTKVMSGMSVEDATFAVLGKAGKLGAAKAPEQTAIAGGSAPTTVTLQEQKTVKDMTQAERRAALMENQGDVADILAPRMRGI